MDLGCGALMWGTSRVNGTFVWASQANYGLILIHRDHEDNDDTIVGIFPTKHTILSSKHGYKPGLSILTW